MKNRFEEDYRVAKGLERRYQEATTEEERQAVREEYTEWESNMETIETEEYRMLFRLYSDAKERGNEHIDFSDPQQYSDTKNLVDAMRTHEIECFTFSSGWSSAVETAWEFLQVGCTLEGMVKINGPHKMILSEEYEKRPAYLFKVN